MHRLNKHQICSVLWGVPKLQGSNLVFLWHGWWRFSWHGRVIPFQTPPPLISSQLAATASSNLWESQLRAFEIVFFWASILVPFFWLPFWELCIGWTSIKFAVFYGVFPSYRGLIWCSSGMAGGSFRTWKGNTISDPSPPDIFSTRCDCLIKFMGKVSWGPLR